MNVPVTTLLELEGVTAYQFSSKSKQLTTYSQRILSAPKGIFGPL